MPRKSQARQEMLQTAIELMRERGVEATSFSELLSHSGAPRGSIYHYFPEGKEQLIMEATKAAGEFIAAGERAVLRHGPLRAVHGITEYWRTVLTESNFLAGCPIAAVAVEGELRPAARDVAGDMFTEWETLMAASLSEHGVSSDRAQSLATTVIAAVEGAVILARAKRSLEPVERVHRELETMVRAALA